MTARSSIATPIALLTFVVALAFTSARPAEAQTPRVLVTLPGFENPVAFDTLGQALGVSGSRAQAYAAVLAAFNALEIPITHRDSLHGAMLNPTYVKMRRIQRTPLSSYFNCGIGMTGPNADHFRLLLAVGAFVDSTSEGTRVRVAVAAGANDIDGASKPAVTCGSTGVLEAEIDKLTARYLTGVPSK